MTISGSTQDRLTALVLGLILFGLAASGVNDYGLTWDEPTYFRFARLQREWLGDLFGAFGSPGTAIEIWTQVLAEERISEVWLQDAALNGHPPLNELWQALWSVPFGWFGMADLTAFRTSIALLLGTTCGLLYLLLRQTCRPLIAAAGVLLFAGVPAIWGHAHIAATEMMQCFFWVLLGVVLPWARKRGVGAIVVWTLLCAFAFMAKFTNFLIPLWALGTIGILGAWREGRFWILAGCGVCVGPLLLVFLDPFFWPWQGGWARFLEYLGQVGSRGEWIPINVFYMGESWGFRPPWHYRIVETASSLPTLSLLAFLPGVGLGLISLWKQLRAQAVTDWPIALGITIIGISLVTGWLPSTPNHDITRQYVFIFLGTAILSAGAFEKVVRRIEGRSAIAAKLSTWTALAVGVISLTIALRAEPFGLGYRAEWLGGMRGAWEKGYEISYWGETITPELLEAVDRLRPNESTPPYIFSIPKLSYFFEAKDHWKPLVEESLREKEHLAIDAYPAFYEPWIPPETKQQHGALLRLTFRRPPQGILFFQRRGAVAGSFDEALQRMEAEGDLVLEAETVIDGVSMARLYRFQEMVSLALEGDPEDRTWYQPAWIHSLARE